MILKLLLIAVVFTVVVYCDWRFNLRGYLDVDEPIFNWRLNEQTRANGPAQSENSDQSQTQESISHGNSNHTL